MVVFFFPISPGTAVSDADAPPRDAVVFWRCRYKEIMEKAPQEFKDFAECLDNYG